MTDFQHPELQEGEVYITDIFPSTFEKVGWKTKRLGKVAYKKSTGEPIPEHFNRRPLFAQRSEVEVAGIDPNIDLDEGIRSILKQARLKRLEEAQKGIKSLQDWLTEMDKEIEHLKKDGGAFPITWCEELGKRVLTVLDEVNKCNSAVFVRSIK